MRFTIVGVTLLGLAVPLLVSPSRLAAVTIRYLPQADINKKLPELEKRRSGLRRRPG